MTPEERRIRTQFALDILGAVALDVVKEENDAGRSATADVVARKIGPGVEYSGRLNPTVMPTDAALMVLRMLEGQGRVENSAGNQRSPGSWKAIE